MEISFVGKTALVTGAGKGIGREVAKLLSKCGANVIALTRTQSDLDTLKEEIPNIQTICADLLNLEESIKAVEAAGHIDLLVNNAAYVFRKSMLEITQDEIEKSFLVNFTAPLRLCQVVAKMNINKGTSASIVNISTMVSHSGVKETAPYSCTKASLETLSKALAVELAPHKIRVNCLLPGMTNTPLLQSFIGSIPPEQFAMMLQMFPMGRTAESEEMAHTVAYLLSDKASYITGINLVSDGGYLCNH